MDRKVTEFQSSVEDVHSTSRFILKRLNETLTVSDTGYHDGACNRSSEPIETELNALQCKVKELEDKISKRDDAHLTDGVQTLNDRLNMIENLLLPIATDDSEIHSAATARQTTDIVNNTKFVDWSGQTDLALTGNGAKNEADTETKSTTDTRDKEACNWQTKSTTNTRDKEACNGQTKSTTDTRDKEACNGQSKGTTDTRDKEACNGQSKSTTDTRDKEACNGQTKGTTDTRDKEACNGQTKGTTDTAAGKENLPKKNHGGVQKDIEDSNTVTCSDSESRKFSRGENKPSRRSHGTINKPNFTETKRQTENVVRQEVKLVYNGESHWRSVAQNELERLRTQFQFLEGVHSVICLDISESMARSNGWTEARTFLNDYLSGLEKMSKSSHTDLKHEYIAFVTFGHETKVQIGYTDHYRDIQTRLDDVTLGGPTQMYGGTLVALAAAWSSRHQIEQLSNSSHVFTKIIVITDGRPTEYDLIAGPDIPDTRKIDETKANILQEMEKFRKDHKDLFFVPVGDSDLDFLNTMVACSGGMLLDYRHGKRLARRQYLTAKLVDPLGLMAGTLLRGSDHDISSEDKEDLQNIQERAKRQLGENVTGGKNMYFESRSKELPFVGSRVRRGPDWSYGPQDQNGPGTIIGHAENNNQVWVEWDIRGHQNIYSYGQAGYDVLLVDEPRNLTSGEIIAVGCEVKPGKDWKSSEGNMQSGVVIKLDKRNRKATVRWNNGRRGDYSYGDGNLLEIEVKTDVHNHSRHSTDIGYASTDKWEPPPAMTIEEFALRQNRNKNKNSNY